MTHRTLVTGGTGLIGGEVIVSLAGAGVAVAALVRATSGADGRRRLFDRLAKSAAWRPEFAEHIDPVVGDTTLEMFGAPASLFDDVGTIVHCAANTRFGDREDEAVWHTNVSSARHLAAAARAATPLARVVFVSTASVVTAPEGACVREDAPYAGYANTYTRSKREAEAIVRRDHPDAIIVRPSIVVSRGVHDRAMARSILWAVPIMGELGDVPIDGGTRIDIVPVDHVARALARLATKPVLAHRLYHISAGDGAHSFTALREAVIAAHPDLSHIHASGRNAKVTDRARARLIRPLGEYLPFINADIRYDNRRLVGEIGGEGAAPTSLSYLPGLIGQITRREALDEMQQP
jgi:nucleoside-diphosphate-sugar epimerase